MTDLQRYPIGNRPYPWFCPGCKGASLWPATVPFKTTLKDHGQSYEINIPDLEAIKCKECDKMLLTSAAEDRVLAQLQKMKEGEERNDNTR